MSFALRLIHSGRYGNDTGLMILAFYDVKSRRNTSAIRRILAVASLLIALFLVDSTSAHAMATSFSSSAGEPTVPSPASGPQQLSRWDWPVPTPHSIVRAFKAPRHRYAAGHRGIDVAAHSGSPISAPTEGVVYFAGHVVDRDVVTLVIDGDVLVSFEPVTSNMRPGTAVHRGENVGTVSTGGHCDSRCLHLGVRVDGEYVSPLLFLSGVTRAVLLPMP